MSAEPSVHLPIVGNIRVKYVALLLLVGQTVGAIISIRISRLAVDDAGHKYLNTTAVFMAELVKLFMSLFLVYRDANYSIAETSLQLQATITTQPIETLKVGVPAFLYTVQNNLIFIGLSNMSPAFYQVTYQLKILTTAVLSVLMLNKSISASKWISLTILTAGVAFIQVPTEEQTTKPIEGNFLLGLVAVLCACVTSGFAGVYFEKILKGSTVSIWMRNIQLAVFGSAIGLLGAYWNDREMIRVHGFFQGYTVTTWIVIFLQSAGGLIVAAVLKYADNILKCFGNALAIVISCLASYFLLGDFVFSVYFVVGTIFVVFSTYSYGVDLNLVGSCLGYLKYNSPCSHHIKELTA